MEIPDLGSGILDVVARSAVVYLVLLALLRFGGKRHVGQLSIADLVLVLLIANGGEGWNGFSVLHTAASRVGALDHRFRAGRGRA